jgi:hypothetical protein
MSRSGYSEDLDPWALIRWRGAVASAIRGKRGQTLLKEMEAALLALPEKKLTRNEFANVEEGSVCALGAVALKRKLEKGVDRQQALKELATQFPEGCEAEQASAEFDISDALAKEITWINDEQIWRRTPPEERYKEVLAWVREQIKKD